MGVEVLIPVAGMAMIVLIVWIVTQAGVRRRTETLLTLRAAVEKGQEITPEAMQAMTRMGSPLADLRRGIIFISVALAVGAFGVAVGVEDNDALRPILGIAAFPLFLGLAFLGLHFFANDSKRA